MKFSLCILQVQSGEQFEIVQEETDSQEDNIETLEQLLDHLSLTDYVETFQKEKIDMDTLVRDVRSSSCCFYYF